MTKPLLIVGTGRSGTTSIVQLFKRLGFSTRKEGMHPFDLELKNEVEVAWGAGCSLDKISDDVVVAHITRHPVKVIRRFLFTFFYDINHIDDAIKYHNHLFPDKAFGIPLDVDKAMEIACEFYCRWNKTIQEQCSKRLPDITYQFKAEEIQYELFNLLRLMDADIDFTRVLSAAMLDTHTINSAITFISNHHTDRIVGDGLYQHITFDDVTPELQDYTYELGYEKDCDAHHPEHWRDVYINIIVSIEKAKQTCMK